MWLSKRQQAQSAVPEAAELGVATIAGNPAAVYLGTERRALPVFSPGGYIWMPKVGDALLVMKCGEQYCVAGAEQSGGKLAAGLEPGEICITNGSEAGILLKKDGSMQLMGEVFINGESLEELLSGSSKGVETDHSDVGVGSGSTEEEGGEQSSN